MLHRPRSVPFALKGAIEQELASLEEKGILKKVNHSEWAAPIVPVPKKDGKVRICGDYKVTVTQTFMLTNIPCLGQRICSQHWQMENLSRNLIYRRPTNR